MSIRYIAPFAVMCMYCSVLLAQSPTVTGVVTDSYGDPIIGASIVVKGNKQVGAYTDVNGKFVLENLPAEAKRIVVSYIGMAAQEVDVKPNLSVMLEEEQTLLKETVVVAFGEQKRSAFTGSAAVVDSKQLEAKQMTNVISALQGEAAGVQMINNSGDPTSTPSIRVRGFSSISAGQAPLIIVDGAPYDGGWNNLNPSDVASVTVLKDASSTALYGARGANGVIMVTTKRAQKKEATISLDCKWGVNSRICRDYDMIDDPAQYYETYYKALYNYQHEGMGLDPYKATIAANTQLLSDAAKGGLGYNVYSIPVGEYLIGENGRLNPSATLGRRVYNNGQFYTVQPDDWKEAAFRHGMRQEYNLNITGGKDDMSFYASLGYLTNEGIAYHSDFDRLSARVRADYQAKSWLKVGSNINFTSSEYDQITADGNGLFYQVNNMAPIYPLYIRDASGNIMYDENGKMYDYGNGTVNGLDRPVLPNINPLQDNALNTDRSQEKMFSASAFADIKFMEGLVLTTNATITLNNTQAVSTENPFYGYWKDNTNGGLVTRTNSNTISKNYQLLLNYKKDLGNHHVELMGGYDYYRYHFYSLWGSKKTMASYLTNQNLSGAINVSDTNDSSNDYNTAGYIFRGQYDYQQRYFANVSVRLDDSSNFDPDNWRGIFYSFGGAWMITAEEWCKPLVEMGINMLKFKASFGQQGNDKIGSYRYKDLYSIVNSNKRLGITLYSIGNKEITWETNSSKNIGIDFELFSGRIHGGLEYFSKMSTEMLSFVYAPYSAGYSGSYYNVGYMMNKGVELEIGATLFKNKRISWDVDFNATHYTNEIIELESSSKNLCVDGHYGYSSSYNYYGEGLPIYTWYMPRYAGVSENGLSQWYYTASDGSLKTTETYGNATKYLCGDSHPTLYGGFGTTLRAYGFDLGIQFTYSLGGKAYDYSYAAAMTNPTGTSGGHAIHRDMLDAWSADNTSSNIPRWQYGDVNTAAQSDRFLTNASYLTLQNINAGYNVPLKWCHKCMMQSIRFYVSGDNLYYWSARKGFDPRGSFTGETSNTSYSPSRTISGGVKVVF